MNPLLGQTNLGMFRLRKVLLDGAFGGNPMVLWLWLMSQSLVPTQNLPKPRGVCTARQKSKYNKGSQNGFSHTAK